MSLANKYPHILVSKFDITQELRTIGHTIIGYSTKKHFISAHLFTNFTPISFTLSVSSVKFVKSLRLWKQHMLKYAPEHEACLPQVKK